MSLSVIGNVFQNSIAQGQAAAQQALATQQSTATRNTIVNVNVVTTQLPPGGLSELFIIPSNPIQFELAKVKPNVFYSQILDGDYIDISKSKISNDNQQDYELSHIASLRPEILSATEVYPVYPDEEASGENLTKVGKLITFKYQSQKMRAAILKDLVNRMSQLGLTPEDLLQTIDQRYELVNNVSKELSQVFKAQKNIATNFNFRRIMDKFIYPLYEQPAAESMKQTFGSVVLPDSRLVSNIFLLEKVTGYNKSQLNQFTNTKLFMTLCSDFSQALSEGVYTTITTEQDYQRIADSNPTTIDLTHTSTYFIDKNVLNREYGPGQNLIVSPTKFNDVQSMLQHEPYHRLTSLLNFLSKEMTYSKYLLDQGRKVNRSLSGNFFEEIFGKPGNTIFDKVNGEKSLITLASLIDSQRNNTILPFESVYIENNTSNSQLSKNYIPGKRYFVDSMLEGIAANNPGLNTQVLEAYTKRSNKIIDETKATIDSFLDIRKSYFMYSSNQWLRYLLTQLDVSTSGLIKQNEIVNQQAFTMCLLRECWHDYDLKLMLFQYIVYAGIYLNKISQGKQYEIFETVANEIATNDNLSMLKNPTSIYGAIFDSRTSSIETINFANITTQQLSTMETQLSIFANNITNYITSKYSRSFGPLRTIGKTNQVVSDINKTTIYNILYSPVQRGKLGRFAAKGNILQNVFDCLQNYDEILESGFFVNTTGTRFRSIQATTIAFLTLETYVSVAKIFGFVNFSMARLQPNEETIRKYGLKGGVTVINDWYKNYFSREKIQLLVGRDTSVSEVVANKTTTQSNGITIKQTTSTLNIIAGSESDTIVYNFAIANNAATSTIQNPGYSKAALADIYALYGTGVVLGKAGDLARPQADSKIYDVYTRLWSEDWYYPIVISAFIRSLKFEIYEPILQTINSFNNPNNLKNIKGTKLRPELENLRIFDQAMMDYIHLRGAINPRPNKQDLERFFTNLAPNQLKLQTLFTLFKDSSFLPEGNPSETRKRVLSIGIPNGMIDSLKQKKLMNSLSGTNSLSFFTEETGVEVDVVRINVFKRDLRFEQLVFKPKQYLFDLSLFMNEQSWSKLRSSLQVSTLNPYSLTLDELISRTTFYNYLPFSASEPNAVVSADAEYAKNIPRNKRYEILRNTFQSYLLNYYISLTTGMVIDEKTFTNTESVTSELNNISFGNSFVKKLIDYLKRNGEPITSTNIQQILAAKNVSRQAKVLLEIASSTTLSVDPGIIYTKLATNPLSFDRVFHILETTDAYEIDIEKTMTTRDGKNLLQNDSFNQRLVKIGDSYYLPFTGMNDASLADYFIDIEVPQF